VQDALDAGKRGQNFRAQQAVGIADDANLHLTPILIGRGSSSTESEQERPATP
jgi:hypothetical protein